MKVINYTAKVLHDGHLPLPEKIREEMGLTVNSTVKITLEKSTHRDEAIKVYGLWSDRSDKKDGSEYVDNIRTDWDDRTKRIDNA